MKKIIILLFSILSWFSFSFASSNTSYEYEYEILFANRTSHEINVDFAIIQNDSTSSNEKEQLMTLADLYDITLVKTKKTTNTGIYEKYLYTHNQNYFKKIGMVLTDEQLKSFYQNNHLPISNQYEEDAYLHFPKFQTSSFIYYYPYTNPENVGIEGDYSISGKNCDSFLSALQNQIPNIEVLIINDTGEVETFHTMQDVLYPTYVKILCFLGCILLVFLLLYFDKKRKNLSLRKC